MKPIIYRLFCLLLHTAAQAQHIQANATDTIVQFSVAGACEVQCKPRIEAAAKIKGVGSASWDASTQTLSLSYNISRTNLQKIQQHIVLAGHDIGKLKANDRIYNALPACCHYRDTAIAHEGAPANHPVVSDRMDSAIIQIPPMAADTPHTALPRNYIMGLVLESTRKGDILPLAGASVVWLGTGMGAGTDAAGMFSIPVEPGEQRLVVSHAGYTPDTITITTMQDLRVILGEGKKLREVIITSRQRSMHLSALNPIRTQVITERELLKAACCNLSESFETNPAVDVAYNDAITGSKQIQLLGLSGNYTQLTVENLPGPRGWLHRWD
jgi:outer membrane receptor for ferrienterochelin and colicins